MGEFSDYEFNDRLLCQLADLDEDDGVQVSSWEAYFIENMLYIRPKDMPLTAGQEDKIREILEKYRG